MDIFDSNGPLDPGLTPAEARRLLGSVSDRNAAAWTRLFAPKKKKPPATRPATKKKPAATRVVTTRPAATRVAATRPAAKKTNQKKPVRLLDLDRWPTLAASRRDMTDRAKVRNVIEAEVRRVRTTMRAAGRSQADIDRVVGRIRELAAASFM